MAKQYWLMKSEPEAFSIDDLAKSPKKTTFWDGVRNYQARNFMRDKIKKGDEVFFYHSRSKPPAIMGTAKVVKEGHPDPTQFEKKSKYYDPKATQENPRWFGVDIQLTKKFKTPLPLPHLKTKKKLETMMLLQKGSRLSVQPVHEKHWKYILSLVS